MPATLEVGASGSKPDQQEGRRKLKRNSTDQGVSAKEDKKVKEAEGSQRKLLKLMIKQMLRLSQQVRGIEGVIFDTVILKANSAEVAGIQEQTKAYGDGVKAKGKKHELGPPHPWAWGGLVVALQKRGVAVGQKNQDTIAAHLQELGEMTTEEKCEAVRFCRITKMFDQQLRRLTISITDKNLRQAVLQALIQTGGERKLGQGPATNMERELQEFIEGMSEQ